MRLKMKIGCLIAAVFLGSLGACGYLTVSGMFRSSTRLLAENEQEKLTITGRALGQVGTREDFEQMGELARDAWLSYQFDRCYPDGYVLLKQDVPLVNKTEFSVINPDGIGGSYGIQELGGRRLLLLREPLSYPEGFSVMAVKDVTGEWNSIRRQAVFLSVCFAAAAMAAVTAVLLIVSRMLRSLDQLEQAAMEISRGHLGCRVEITSDDEMGRVAGAFNQMSVQVESQVENLELLLGALAHEMKTPVTSIMGYADSLMRVRLKPEQQERALQNIYAAGERMEKMSAKLLSLVGLYDNESVECLEIPVSRLLAQTEIQTREIFSTRNIRFLWKCPPEMTVIGDETLLISLFSNLAENGCKASDSGGTVTAEGSGRRIVIQDRGRGIPEKDLPHVKEPFYMADKSRSRSQGGSGLGLALGDRIAALHGASLKIESAEGEGTRVTVTFPE